MMKVIKPPAEYADKYEPGPVNGATKTAAGIRDCFVVAHGIQGCTFAGNFLRSGGPEVEGPHLPLVETGLRRTDIILGSNEEIVLRMARRQFERLKGRAKLILLTTSDATSIIEDDIRSMAVSLEKELKIPVIPLDTPGFFGGFNRGAEMVWCGIFNRFVKEASPEKKAVNLVGPHIMGSKNWPDDIEEIVRLLKAADVPVNHVAFKNISVDQLPELGRAEANYVLTVEEFPDFAKKCRDLGVRLWGQDIVLPLGIHNTEEWYLAVAREFGDVEKAKAQMVKDMDYVKRRVRTLYNSTWALSTIAGKHCGIYGYAPFAVAMARCAFYDFNLRPNVIGLIAETPQALERAEKLLEPMTEYLDFEVMENPTFYSWGEKLKEAKPEFSIGMLQDRMLTEGLGIPHLSLGGFYFYNQFDFVPWPYMGVRGVLRLMGELYRTVERVLQEPNLWQLQSYKTRDELIPALQAD